MQCYMLLHALLLALLNDAFMDDARAPSDSDCSSTEVAPPTPFVVRHKRYTPLSSDDDDDNTDNTIDLLY